MHLSAGNIYEKKIMFQIQVFLSLTKKKMLPNELCVHIFIIVALSQLGFGLGTYIYLYSKEQGQTCSLELIKFFQLL